MISLKSKLLYSLILAFIVLIFYCVSQILPPKNFITNQILTIKSGEGLNIFSVRLKNQNLIKNQFLFKIFSLILSGSRGLKAGDYLLDQPENSFKLAARFNSGDYNLKPIKLTIPEGLNNQEISKLFNKNFTKFSVADFIIQASSSEGFLFPDTYYFLPNISTEQIIIELRSNFNERIKTLNREILTSGKSLTDIVKVASILELEARTDETRRLVAGILWSRLALNMPLQVDSSLKYINGKSTKDLTIIDLKLDSPYNSYTHKGLPPTPISNPGLASIKAALTPIKTNYLYFLTDSQGNMHYAKTYAEHLQNKSLYLK